MRHLDTEREARSLLPQAGTDPGAFHAILFWKAGEAASETALGLFAGLRWPRGWDVAALPVDQAPEAARWFGLNRTPAVAVIQDGSVLALGFDCDARTCDRLQAWAHAQSDRLRRAG